MTTLTFKVTEADARMLRDRARLENLTLSEYVRRHVLEPAQSPPVDRIKCPHTGALIFAPMPTGARLTTGSVREMLSDFA